jgi:hypothetical protein
MLDYRKGIHPDSGKKYEMVGDFVITPFLTEDFCNDLVSLSESMTDRFETDHLTSDLQFWKISRFLFEDYARHYKQCLVPILEKEFIGIAMTGVFSPFIVRHYVGQSSHSHHDISKVSLSIKLNNNYTGGVIEFPRQNFNNKEIPIGYAALWPSSVSHPHNVTAVTEGTKYTIVGFSFPYNWSSNPQNGIYMDHIV